MTTRNADVNLIVRARTEGDKAVAGLGDILETLFDEARGGSHDIAELGKTIGALDKAAAAITGSMDKAGAAIERQRTKVQEAKDELAALVAQQEAGARAIASMQDRLADHRADISREYRPAGSDAALAGQVAAATSEQARLAAQVDRLRLTLRTLETQAQGSQSSLLKLSASGTAVAEGQAAAEARIELTNQALREQAEAAEHVSEVQRRINDLTGVSRPDASGSAAAVADLLAAADAEFRRMEAVRAEEAATRALNNQFAERANLEAAIQRSTGNGRVRATDAGATYSALTELVNKEHEATQASEEMDKQAAHLRAVLDPLAAIQKRFNDELARYQGLAAAGKISGDELAAAETHLAAEAEKARKALNDSGSGPRLGLFGLKPYELQNLSYQVNDVVTGLASGQHATQIIAQQGGQILQLFPKFAGAVIGALSNPLILAGLGTIVAIGAAIKGAADDAERLRGYTATLGFRADGGSYNAKDLAEQQKSLERMGASADDAKAALTSFLDKGVAPERISTFSRIAREASETLGLKLPEAASLLADAFTGGYDSVAKLDDKLNFLSASQRAHIQTLFDEGRATEAQTEALNIYARKQDELAAKSRGEWGDAIRSLSLGYHDFFGALSDSAFVQAVLHAFESLAGHIERIAAGMQRAANYAKIAAATKDVNSSADDLDAAKKTGNAQQIAAAQRANAEAAARLLALQGNPQDLAPAGSAVASTDQNSAVAKKRNDQLRDISMEDELQRLRDAGQQRLLTAAEQARREELAGLAASKSASDSVVAAAEKRRAIAHETAAIEKETDARSKQAASDREREIHQFEGRVVGAEGGAGKNPFGSASGYGQFTKGTFLNQFAKVFPQESKTLPQEQILALRQNEQVARAIIDNYARENAKFLESFGAKVTAGNLYLAHFLGAGGAKAVLTASPDKPVDQIIRRLPNAAATLAGNQGYLRTEGGKGRYRTAGELQAFLGNRVGDTGQPQTQGQVEINNLLEEGVRRQNAFNEGIRHSNEDRQDAIKALREENGLYGTALLAAQRQKAITDAEREARQKAEDANKNLKPGETPVVISPEQIRSAREFAAALFDAQHARDALAARQADAQRPVDDLTQQRDLLKQQAEFLRSIGDNNSADAVDKQVMALTGDIGSAYDKLIQFYQALSPDQRVHLGIVDQAQLDNVITKLEQAKQSTQEWGKVAGVSAQTIAQSFASGVASTFTAFVNKIAAGKNVFKSLGESVREFAASFISSIAQMIVQTLAFAAIVEVLRNLGVPIPASISVGQHHSGGIAGSAGGVKRAIDPAIYTAALRYHTGGVVGLGPDEVPAVLKRGEEVLTTGDPRHRGNGGASTGGPSSTTSVKNVNLFDPADMLQQALSDEPGQKVILNHVSRNPRAWRSALGLI